MEPPTSLSAFFHYLYDSIKKFLDSVAVSDFNIRKLSDLTEKFLASDTVVHVLQWFKKENVPTMVAVVVIVLLFLRCCRCLAKIAGSCCGCLAWSVRSFCGSLFKSVKTMKAPGRNYRMPRSNFEANPCAYFRDLRKR
ncbi:hypothetical protein POTOM_058694 [Populus tomentosa]|uniref:Uncharacterized protein n=2 Tax=Populus TaxID=3689 RepID=A0A4U5MNJ1_POPAL|nr:hypothetical protein POTOM_058694 [Populus tomentosa]TKR71147.1 hypothetical protein D5086_0000303920 [Populus alba]